jgi:molybdenum cofactor cytidylyltransferase
LRSAQALRGAVANAIAVVSPQDRELLTLFERAGLETCVCARSSEGMGASLACGVRASANADGWIIALADMPFIQPATLGAIVRALRDGAAIAAPTYAGKRGHPVGFGQEYYAELAALSGDEGARAIVQRDDHRVVLVAVSDPGIHGDIDTPEDLRQRLDPSATGKID